MKSYTLNYIPLKSVLPLFERDTVRIVDLTNRTEYNTRYLPKFVDNYTVLGAYSSSFMGFCLVELYVQEIKVFNHEN